MTIKRKYLWRPSPIDVRDHAYSAPGIAVPTAVDLSTRPEYPAIYDQGQLGSCTGNALARAHAMLHPGFDPARLFIYYNERAMEGTVRSDAGAFGRDGAKSLQKQGVCSEKELPYNVAKFRTKPPAKCYKDALAYTIGGYQFLHTLDDMLQCLASGNGFVFGFQVFESFEGAEVAKTGVLNLPKPGEKNLGGHEVFCHGYNLATKRFDITNSWGPLWGIKGKFTMPFAYVTNRKLADDFVTLKK